MQKPSCDVDQQLQPTPQRSFGAEMVHQRFPMLHQNDQMAMFYLFFVVVFFKPLPQSVTLCGSPTKGHDLGKGLSCLQLRRLWKDKQLQALGNKPFFLKGGSSCPPHILNSLSLSFSLLSHSFNKYQCVFDMPGTISNAGN